MKRWLFLPLLALAGCGTGDEPGNRSSADAPAKAVQTSQLTGLYEGGEGPQRNQMCIVDRATGDSRFGLVVWGPDQRSCSGSGQATRQGNVLRLAMSGDEQCVIEARIEGTRVSMPQTLPAGCAYYCGAGARMTGAAFDKTGGTAEDAMRAVDLVGDSLCGSTR
jgi:hypothetical protein